MYVQGVPILTTISSYYNFRTVDPLLNKRKAKKDDMIEGLNQVIQIYQSRGFNVIQIAVDNVFECIKEEISPVFLNVSAAEEHVSKVEHSIRTIKERAHCQLNRLPYTHYPRMLMLGAITFAVKSLNLECGVSKLSKHLSPITLITGLNMPTYNKLKELGFGNYVQVHNGEEVTNMMSERTNDTIALYPSGNLQGGWKVLSLLTGRMHHRRQWKRLPSDGKSVHSVVLKSEAMIMDNISDVSNVVEVKTGVTTAHADSTDVSEVEIEHGTDMSTDDAHIKEENHKTESVDEENNDNTQDSINDESTEVDEEDNDLTDHDIRESDIDTRDKERDSTHAYNLRD